MIKPNVTAMVYMVAMLCLFSPVSVKALSVLDLPGSSDTIALDWPTNAVSRDLIIRRGSEAKIFEIPGARTLTIGRNLLDASKVGSDRYWIVTGLGPMMGGAVLLDYTANKIVKEYTGARLSISPYGDYIVWKTHGSPAVIVCNGAIAFYDKDHLSSTDEQRIRPDDMDIYALLKEKIDYSKCTIILEGVKWVSPSEFCFVLGETLREPSEDCMMVDAETSYSVRVRISEAEKDQLSFNATIKPGPLDYESVPQNYEQSHDRRGDVTKDEILTGTVVQRVKLLLVTPE